MASSDPRDWFVVYLKGICMGAADSVPGVSGGTIAVITGIYERLIAAVTALDPRVLRHVPRLHRREGRTALWTALVGMDLGFLIVLGLGVFSALVVVSEGVQAALDAAPGLTFAFFFGLIAASAVVLYGEVLVDSVRRWAVAVSGFAIAFFVSGVSESTGLPHSPPMVFVAGTIAISAMILPGISGAFFLILLGQYDFLTATLSSFVRRLLGLLDGGSVGALLDPLTTIVAFGLGAVVGLLTVAHVIKRALAEYREATLIFLVSLMVGALRLPALKVLDGTPAWTPTAVVATVAAGGVGVAAVLLLDRYTDDLDYT